MLSQQTNPSGGGTTTRKLSRLFLNWYAGPNTYTLHSRETVTGGTRDMDEVTITDITGWNLDSLKSIEVARERRAATRSIASC